MKLIQRKLTRTASALGMITLAVASTRCASGDEQINQARQMACDEIEKLDAKVVRQLVVDAQDALAKVGITISSDVWTKPGNLIEWVNKVRTQLGCAPIEPFVSFGPGLSPLHEGGTAWYCGSGHNGESLFVMEDVAPCLNLACEKHDSCYARCSKQSGTLCMWANKTDPCDQDFFDRADQCSFPFGTKINSWAVYLAAYALKALPGTGLSCDASMQCPRGDVDGFGPCAKEPTGEACRSCLDRADPGRTCLKRACQSGADPCVNENCAGAQTQQVCYTANCPTVDECYGWGSLVAPPCTNGATRSCDCPAGTTGVQRCSAGSWSTCGCACKPGDVRSCTCSGGTAGTQTCNDTGTAYSACGGCSASGCSPSNPKGTCPSGMTCLSGSCCPTAQACGTGSLAACCDSASTCVTWTAGEAPKCATTCATSLDCPTDPVAGAPGCCRVLASGGVSIKARGACGPAAADSCRCAKSFDCASGICAPHLGSVGGFLVPDGPYVCTANDEALYHGCGDCWGGACASSGGKDCWKDAITGSSYCAYGCTTDADCGNPGVACCKAATCDNCVTSCAYSRMCAPC